MNHRRFSFATEVHAGPCHARAKRWRLVYRLYVSWDSRRGYPSQRSWKKFRKNQYKETGML